MSINRIELRCNKIPGFPENCFDEAAGSIQPVRHKRRGLSQRITFDRLLFECRKEICKTDARRRNILDRKSKNTVFTPFISVAC
jgi:hypothetical protein